MSTTQEIAKSLLATGFYSHDEDRLKDQLHLFQNVVGKARGIRRPGAAAYDMAMVACGVFDGFWESSLAPWDTAGGTVLVREAGGVVTEF